MKVKIKKKQVTYEIIDIELPYFYKHDLGMEHGYSVIYGCIDGQKDTSIKVSMDSSGKETYEIEIEKITGDEVPMYYTSHFESIHASNKDEFQNAFIEALRTLQSIGHEHDFKF